MKILPKYIIRQLIITLFFALAVYTFVLLMGNMMKQLTDLLVNRHLGLGVVAWFVALMMPSILSFSLPMALLAAVLLVFGRMSADHEITAMRANGVGLGGVAAPVILLSVLLAGVCFYINATLAPQCRFQYRTLFFDLGTKKPMELLEEGVCMKDFPGYMIYVGRKNKTNVEDVVLYMLNTNGNVTASLRAKTGTVTGYPATKKLVLDLYDVQGDIRDAKDPTNIGKIHPGATVGRYPVELDLGKAFKQASVARKLPDLLFGELLQEIRDLRSRGIYPAAALMEAHQRVASAVACIAFALLGIPLGIRASRKETSIGIALSLGLALIFYLVTVLANALRNKPYLYPEAILWSPNLIFELVGLWLLWRVSKV